MNCKYCGAILVQGQTICSNCGNFNDMEQNVVNDFNRPMQSSLNNYNQTISSNTYDLEEKDTSKKQKPIFKVSSYIALLLGIAMLIMQSFMLYANIKIDSNIYLNLIGIVISIFMVIYAFFINNFNIGKNKFFDSKIVFIIFMILNLIFGIVYRAYFVVFILNLIGFISKTKDE